MPGFRQLREDVIRRIVWTIRRDANELQCLVERQETRFLVEVRDERATTLRTTQCATLAEAISTAEHWRRLVESFE